MNRLALAPGPQLSDGPPVFWQAPSQCPAADPGPHPLASDRRSLAGTLPTLAHPSLSVPTRPVMV